MNNYIIKNLIVKTLPVGWSPVEMRKQNLNGLYICSVF